MCVCFGLVWIVSFGLSGGEPILSSGNDFCLCIIKTSGNAVFCLWNSEFYLTFIYISVLVLQEHHIR